MDNVNNATILNSDTLEYLSKFHEPEISACSLLKAFFAKLYMSKIYEVKEDLSPFFIYLKDNEKYEKILSDIHFKSNGIFMFSNELEDGIAFLKNLNLLYTEVVSNHKLYIRYDFSEAKRDFEKLSKQHQILISDIVDEYIHFIK